MPDAPLRFRLHTLDAEYGKLVVGELQTVVSGERSAYFDEKLAPEPGRAAATADRRAGLVALEQRVLALAAQVDDASPDLCIRLVARAISAARGEGDLTPGMARVLALALLRRIETQDLAPPERPSSSRPPRAASASTRASTSAPPRAATSAPPRAPTAQPSRGQSSWPPREIARISVAPSRPPSRPAPSFAPSRPPSRPAPSFAPSPAIPPPPRWGGSVAPAYAPEAPRWGGSVAPAYAPEAPRTRATHPESSRYSLVHRDKDE